MYPASALAEAPVSKRKNRQPTPQIKDPVTSAAADPSAALQFSAEDRETKTELNGKTPTSPPLMYSGEIQPEDFSFNKEQVRSSYSAPTPGNATPVLGVSVRSLSYHFGHLET